MFGKTSTRTVAQQIFHHPTETWHLRELARETGLSVTATSSAVDELEQQGLLTVETGVTKDISAADSQQFRDTKRVYNLWELTRTDLIDDLEDTTHPEAIVLFGSYSRGEDTADSDIDIAVVNGTEHSLDLAPYQEHLNRTISLTYTDMETAGENFKTSLANGITLRGYLDL